MSAKRRQAIQRGADETVFYYVICEVEGKGGRHACKLDKAFDENGALVAALHEDDVQYWISKSAATGAVRRTANRWASVNSSMFRTHPKFRPLMECRGWYVVEKALKEGEHPERVIGDTEG